MISLAQYDAARAALAQATRVAEVLPLCRQMEHVKLFARQVLDRALLADATELQLRAERRLGELLHEAEAAGLLRPGRPPKAGPTTSAPKNGSAPERFTLAEAGISRKLSMRAQQAAALSADEAETRIERARERIVTGRAKIIEETVDDKAAARATREAVLGAKICAMPARRYGVIYDDPEWRHEVFSRETGLDRGADNHYPTSPLADILARDAEMIATIAAPTCAWLRWTPNQFLAHAIRSVEIDGFTYRTNFAWDKGRLSTGYWNRSRHELLLLAVRGDVPCPAPGTQWDSLLAATPAEHSAKPEHVLEMIEAYFPTLPKIELNRRGAPRPGWDAWGNEVVDDAMEAA